MVEPLRKVVLLAYVAIKAWFHISYWPMRFLKTELKVKERQSLS